MEIRRYLKLVARWWWLLVLSTLIPMVVSYYFTSQQPDLYQAKVTIMVGTSLFQNPNPDQWQMNLSNTLAAAYAELVRQGPVAEAVIERLGLNRTPGQLAGQIGTRIYSGAQLLEIQVTDTNPEAAALIANALADELIRRSPASGGSDPEQQEFIRVQLEELQTKIQGLGTQIDELTASLSELTSAAEIQESKDRIVGLEEARSTYQTTYANLLDSYRAESPNALALFDPALVPQWPIPSKAKLVVVIAGVAGLGLALGAIFMIEYLDTSLQWQGDGLQSILDLPVLGAIPRVSRRRASLSSDPLSPVAEGIRGMRANIFLMSPDRPFETLLLTSPGDLEGKSFMIANLAIVLASGGNRVVVIDADMRDPSLHTFFDRPNVKGLSDVLSNHGVDGERFLSVPLQETSYDNLYLLSAGRPPVDPAALLASPCFVSLLKSLRDQKYVVLMDSPPLLAYPDAAVLATLAEGTLLVVSVGVTKHDEIQQARDRLMIQRGVNLLGFAVNRVKPRRGYYGERPVPETSKQKRRQESSDRTGLTLSEAAERLGISRDQARRWCESGQLPATRKGLWWRLDRGRFERLIEDLENQSTSV